MPAPFRINRVVVHGQLACDVRLRAGLNVLQSTGGSGDAERSNKTGKSGFVYLIQYGLGKTASKEKFHFKPIAEKLSYLYLEVQSAQAVITIQRSLQGPSSAVRVFSGPYRDGIDAEVFETKSVEDLSDFLLNFSGIPSVKVKEESGDLTPLSFRLLMRAFVLEQRLSFSELLNKVVPERRKADIIGFLTGIFPARRFLLEEELSEVQVEADSLQVHFERVRAFLQEHGLPSLAAARQKVAQLEKELDDLREHQRTLRQAVVGVMDRSTPGRLDNLRKAIVEKSSEILQLKRKERNLRGEIERLTLLAGSLQRDLSRLRKVRASQLVLSTIEFDACPRCLQSITREMQEQEQIGVCSVCSRPAVRTSDSSIVSLPNEDDIVSQLRETQEVLAGTREELAATEAYLRAAEAVLHRLESELQTESGEYVSPFVDALAQIAHDTAILERELAIAQADQAQAERLDTIAQRLEAVRQRQADLVAELKSASQPKKELLAELSKIYSEVLSGVEYPNYSFSSISSSDFMPRINGNLYIHDGAAYTGVAVLAYHLAMLKYGLEHECPMPTFMAIDSPRVGDLNPKSEDALLDYLADLQEDPNEDVSWQIILTTRRVTSKLEPFVFQKLSNPEKMLLRSSSELAGELGALFG